MRCTSFVYLLIINLVVAFGAEVPAQDPTPESNARRRFNQVYVKVIVPVTARTPHQDGRTVESWVTEQLKELGDFEYFALTDWVPICDGLLEDDEVDNRVWPSRLDGSAPFCPVGGDIPERSNGRVTVSVTGWAPVAGYGAKVELTDEPGTRAVEPVLAYSVNGEKEQVQVEKPMAYVAVLVGPPPANPITSHCDTE
jgi:hypothetical protein